MKNSYSNIFSFNKNILKKTIKNLNNGNIVGLPTEPVYGLGGNAYSKKSIEKIYRLITPARNISAMAIGTGQRINVRHSIQPR